MLTAALELAELALPNVTVPGPLTKLQLPVPTAGVLPAKFVVKPQTPWLLPATEAVGFWK